MTNFPGSPRLSKGSIVFYDLPNLVPKVIVFQYNPETLTRTLEAQTGTSEISSSEAFRLKGPPVETISLDVELDATDQLEKPDRNSNTVSMGIYPQLSALEMILYPKSSQIIANNQLEAAGTLEVQAADSPLTLFIWGSKRIVPVRLTGFSITEQHYDANLNPINAKVSLKLRVLSSSDLLPGQPGYSLYLSYQMSKESMASVGTNNNLSSIGNPNINF